MKFLKASFSVLFISSILFGEQEEGTIRNEVEPIYSWWATDRHQEIYRPYSADKVASLRETLIQEYPSHSMAQKLWRLLKNAQERGKYSHTFGAMDSVQAIEMAYYLNTVYVSGWQCSSTASTTNEPGPDYADYPMDTVPNKVQQLFEAQRFHDRKQREARSRMSKEERAAAHPIDYLCPIIADADMGHGGLTAVMKVTKLFIQRGAAAIHFEDQKPGGRKIGTPSVKVLVSTQEHCDRLIASRLQADILGSDLILIGRTDARDATHIDTNIDPKDHAFILGATNSAIPSFSDVLRLAVDKYERRKNRMEYEAKLKWLHREFPILAEKIQLIWISQDQAVEKSEVKALGELASEWIEEANLKTYYEAIVDAIENSDREDKQILLKTWRTYNDPLHGASSAEEPLNGLSHREAVSAAKELGFEIYWDWEAPRVCEGYYRIKGGVAMAIARARAFAPYCDMLWMETTVADLKAAECFANGVRSQYPKKFLAYNLPQSFNWEKAGISDEQIASYQDILGRYGYVWQFITVCGFHGDALFAHTFARDFAERKMLAYVQKIQRKEREHDVKASAQQQWSGIELIEAQQDAATGHRMSAGVCR